MKWSTELSPGQRQSHDTQMSDEVTDAEATPPPDKIQKVSSIRAKYLLKRSTDGSSTATPRPVTVRSQLEKYLNWQHGEVKYNVSGDVEEIDPLKFWYDNTVSEAIPALAKLAKMVLCVPATSAPIERVFSHGGIIFRPHRRQMSSQHLTNAIFLKCNRLRLNQ